MNEIITGLNEHLYLWEIADLLGITQWKLNEKLMTESFTDEEINILLKKSKENNDTIL